MTNRTFKSGACREQGSLPPPRVDDYVGPDNPVRAIDAYVCSLDLYAQPTYETFKTSARPDNAAAARRSSA